MLSMNVSEAREVADKALVHNRSFASVVAGKCDRGFLIDIHKESAGRSRYSLAILHFLFTINKYIKLVLSSDIKMVKWLNARKIPLQVREVMCIITFLTL